MVIIIHYVGEKMLVNLLVAIQLIAVEISDLNKVADPLVNPGHVSCVVNEMQFTEQFHTLHTYIFYLP